MLVLIINKIQYLLPEQAETFNAAKVQFICESPKFCLVYLFLFYE